MLKTKKETNPQSKYRHNNVKPDKVTTVHMADDLYKKLMKYYNRRWQNSNRHIYLSEIIREALIRQIKKTDVKIKKLTPKQPMVKRISFTITNELMEQLKLCSEQNNKNQSDFIRMALEEYLNIS